jgi:hypothetical protein
VQPYVTRANETIIKPTRERVAPLVAKLESKRAELVESPRYKHAIRSLEHVRAHPIEAAKEFKATAIDLIKYDNLLTYREYVQSSEFFNETVKLVTEELPKLIEAARQRGLTLVHSQASALKDEFHAKRTMVAEAWDRGYLLGYGVEAARLRARAAALVDALNKAVGKAVGKAGQKLGLVPEGALGEDFDVKELIARLTKAFGLDKLFPTAAGCAPSAEGAADGAAPCCGGATGDSLKPAEAK